MIKYFIRIANQLQERTKWLFQQYYIPHIIIKFALYWNEDIIIKIIFSIIAFIKEVVLNPFYWHPVHLSYLATFRIMQSKRFFTYEMIFPFVEFCSNLIVWIIIKNNLRDEGRQKRYRQTQEFAVGCLLCSVGLRIDI